MPIQVPYKLQLGEEKWQTLPKSFVILLFDDGWLITCNIKPGVNLVSTVSSPHNMSSFPFSCFSCFSEGWPYLQFKVLASEWSLEVKSEWADRWVRAGGMAHAHLGLNPQKIKFSLFPQAVIWRPLPQSNAIHIRRQAPHNWNYSLASIRKQETS